MNKVNLFVLILCFFFLDIPEPDLYWSFDQENVGDIKEIKSSMQAIIRGSSKSLSSISFTYYHSISL